VTAIENKTNLNGKELGGRRLEERKNVKLSL
jgi:hypothetical protein